MQTEPLSRRQAIEAGAALYVSTKPCRRGHVSARRTCSGVCVDCEKSYQKTEADRARDRAWLAEWRKTAKGREKMRADRARQRLTEKGRAARKAAVAKFNATERGRAAQAARCAARRARVAQPAGRDEAREIRGFYEMARRVSACIGIPHEVDHVHPLAGCGFSGLHVPWNLRVVPRAINARKGNRLETVK